MLFQQRYEYLAPKSGSTVKISHFVQQENRLDFSFVAVRDDCSCAYVAVAEMLSDVCEESGETGVRDRISGRMANAYDGVVVLREVEMLIFRDGFQDIVQPLVAGLTVCGRCFGHCNSAGLHRHFRIGGGLPIRPRNGPEIVPDAMFDRKHEIQVSTRETAPFRRQLIRLGRFMRFPNQSFIPQSPLMSLCPFRRTRYFLGI